MSKKKVDYSANVVITSAEHAQEMSEKLPSVWSSESLLSQRILIYVAKLLEEQHAEIAKAAQQSVYLTAFGVAVLAFFTGFGICWFVFFR